MIMFTKMLFEMDKVEKSKNKSICLIEDCNVHAINSHLFSKNSILEPITENKKLITIQTRVNPRIIFRDMYYEWIGINLASTFKGFCPEHDGIFYSIDIDGIKSEQDVLLQSYRIIAYSYYKEFIFGKNENKIFGTNIFHVDAYEKSKESNNYLMMNFLEDMLLKQNYSIDSPLDIPHNRSKVYQLTNDNMKTGLCILVRKTKFFIPVAFHFTTGIIIDGVISDITITTIPNTDHNIIIICGFDKHVNKINNQFHTDISTLNFLESIMINDSDFYLSPSEFNSWSEEKKQFILDEYYSFDDTNLFKKNDFSVFDKVRLSITSDKDELEKIEKFPKRAPRNVRSINASRIFINSYKLRNSYYNNKIPK